MLTLLKETLLYVVATLIHNAPVLALGILAAAAIKVYIDPEKFRQVLVRRTGVSIPATVAFGAFTPFCACGTMVVIVSMLTTALPWAPIMAFLTSSPLMSPDEFILYSGIVSVRFAVALAAASVTVGLGSGYITHLIEKHTHFLDGQARFAKEPAKPSCCGSASETVSACGCAKPAVTAQVVSSCGCSASKAQNFAHKYKLRELLKVFFEVGIKQVLVYFSIFAAIGFMINKYVPATIIMEYLGSGNKLAVPMLAFIGLPLYVNGSSSIPVINSLMAGGASSGALLAFMITGPGTSAGVLAGIATIMKKRAIGLYIIYLLVFAIVLGYLYDFLLMLGII
jgi:uncharacterized membrane protein YraQ (UPF0718 family)